eukprot:gnl/MRDRNA2_/MRDRNA2_72339_c0_seq1.p1 gnl/MRDRNA2_/MRDRNA2_72339_c0~~gnl/MRDRNA2_/MRDRNA2_72339_c0_seq1.p1  ORF type:complete len:388 (+),score=40.52 gnl/MRDRNA2_/MRDRNA2_72339_c0_seq1:92-1165(+)
MGDFKRLRTSCALRQVSEQNICQPLHLDTDQPHKLDISVLPVWSILAFLGPDIDEGLSKWNRLLGCYRGPMTMLLFHNRLWWIALRRRGFHVDASMVNSFSFHEVWRKLCEGKWHVMQMQIHDDSEMKNLMKFVDDEASNSGILRHRCMCNLVYSKGVPLSELVLTRFLCTFKFSHRRVSKVVSDFQRLPQGTRSDGSFELVCADSDAVTIPGLPDFRIRLVLEGSKCEETKHGNGWCFTTKIEWCHDQPPQSYRTRLVVKVICLRSGDTGAWRLHDIDYYQGTWMLNQICSSELLVTGNSDMTLEKAIQDNASFTVRCGVVVSAHSRIGMRGSLMLRMQQRQAFEHQRSLWSVDKL